MAERSVYRWRVGSKVPVNVYEGDRPVCQCHTAADAKRIVLAVNAEPLQVRRDAIEEAINEVCTGRTINNFGHVPEVRRALEWLTMDLRGLQEKMTS